MDHVNERMAEEMSDTSITQSSYRELTTADRPAGFLDLPGEIRNRVYELVLLDKHPLYPWFTPSSRYHWRQNLATGLLHASKAVHREASSLFYGQNRFDFAYVSPERIISFLEKIGSNNASHIRHIIFNFPRFPSLYLDDITLDVDSVKILETIQKGCVNVRTLTMSLNTATNMECIVYIFENRETITEALGLINSSLRAIPSLQDIIVEVSEKAPNELVRRLGKAMESHRWRLNKRGLLERN